MPTQKYAQKYIATGNQVKVHVGKFGNVAYVTKYLSGYVSLFTIQMLTNTVATPLLFSIN